MECTQPAAIDTRLFADTDRPNMSRTCYGKKTTVKLTMHAKSIYLQRTKRACVRACVRVCVRACVRAFVRSCVRACVRASTLAQFFRKSVKNIYKIL